VVDIGSHMTPKWGPDRSCHMTIVTDQAASMLTQRQGQTSRPPGTSLGQLPLAGNSVLIIEDEALIALGFESCLQDAGAAVVIANSIALAQSALDEGIPFDAAVVDLRLADGNASALIQVLSERGIPVVITTGDEVDRGHPALSKAVAILQKPHADSDLINAIIQKAEVARPITGDIPL
jgi:CheY-like chemotaxis protein